MFAPIFFKPARIIACLFLVACLGVSTGVRSQQQTTRLAEEPIHQIIQTALDSSPRLFDKNTATRDYLKTFQAKWKEILTQLFTQDASEIHLESFFAANEKLTRSVLPVFQKMKAPSDFRDFEEVFLRGLEELSDWCLDMRDRIHYAKTPYQKNAYMKRIEGFRTEWYDSFFGEALDELTNAMSIYLNVHWKDNLDSGQEKTLKSDPKIKRYLDDYHKAMISHLKAVAAMTKKAREAKEKNKDSDALTYLNNVEKETEDLKKIVRNLRKVTPPDSFKNFHTLQLSWLDSAVLGNQKILELEQANEKHASDEQIQAFINEKNQIDQQTRRLRADVDKAYLEALKLLSAATPGK